MQPKTSDHLHAAIQAGAWSTAQELLAAGGVPTREQIRVHLSGNYCRCTGYQAIVDAIESVAQARANR